MKIQKIRFEPFGGIIGTEDPIRLIWVDKEYLKNLGYCGGEIWEKEIKNHLNSPLEMEITITKKCNLNCPICYADSSYYGENVEKDKILKTLEIISEINVFHVSFGGGEPLLHPNLIEFGEYARKLNLIPSITTNGTLINEDFVKKCKNIFGRINISIDLTKDHRDDSVNNEKILKKISLLKKYKIETGINHIITRTNFDDLEKIFEISKKYKVQDIFFLRIKPSGKGKERYKDLNLTKEQQKAFIKKIFYLGRKYKINFGIDCSFTPLVFKSKIPKKKLELLGVYGCIAGNILLTVDENGFVHPCSHLNFVICKIEDLKKSLEKDEFFGYFRERDKYLKGDCENCDVKDLCFGGCAVVNEFYGLNYSEKDPDIYCD